MERNIEKERKIETCRDGEKHIKKKKERKEDGETQRSRKRHTHRKRDK
jgi:hypothetical protein